MSTPDDTAALTTPHAPPPESEKILAGDRGPAPIAAVPMQADHTGKPPLTFVDFGEAMRSIQED